MRKLLIISLFLLGACSAPSAPEVFTTSLDVDGSNVESVLTALDELTNGQVDVAGLQRLTETTKMDEEQQERFAITFGAEETEILYHVWREQENWVHLYVSSESENLVEAIKLAIAPFERDSG